MKKEETNTHFTRKIKNFIGVIHIAHIIIDRITRLSFSISPGRSVPKGGNGLTPMGHVVALRGRTPISLRSSTKLFAQMCYPIRSSNVLPN